MEMFLIPGPKYSPHRVSAKIEKAEAMLDNFVEKGRKPPSTSSWGIVAVGYAEKSEIAKAYEFTLNALCVYAPNGGWKPSSDVIKSILHYLGDEGGVEAVETSVGLLRNAVPINRHVSHTDQGYS